MIIKGAIFTSDNVTNTGEEGENLPGSFEEGGETEHQPSQHTEKTIAGSKPLIFWPHLQRIIFTYVMWSDVKPGRLQQWTDYIEIVGIDIDTCLDVCLQ